MTLLLLHGAIGASSQLAPLQQLLAPSFDARLFDFPGHGGNALPEEAFSIRRCSEATIAFMDEQQLESVDIFGYSMGGYVALYMARHWPGRVNRIFTLATKLHWDEATAAREVKMLDPEKIEEKVPKFAAALAKRHAPADWKTVLAKTAELMQQLGRDPELKDEDFKAITLPVRITIGDRDTMVSIEETLQVYRLLPAAQLQVFPQTPHPVEQVDVKSLGDALTSFFA